MMDSVIKIIMVAAVATLTIQCGVKGDPLPPLQPHVTDHATDRFGSASESSPGADENSEKKKDR